MTIRERIKDLCGKNGISMNQLEEKCGFGKGYISKLDKSKPNSAKLQKIADHLNVSMDYLITGKDEEFSDESAHLVSVIRNDLELTKALNKYFKLNDVKKKHVLELINLLSEV